MGRSAFVARAVEDALNEECRWDLIESSLGSIEADGHEWDHDPASWVRKQRRTDEHRIG